jgi:hypothetical protein
VWIWQRRSVPLFTDRLLDYALGDRHKMMVFACYDYRMETSIPEDLRSDVKADAVRILEILRGRGWSVEIIRWNSRSSRTVEFSATSPSGTGRHTVCGESELVDRLEILLLSLNEILIVS